MFGAKEVSIAQANIVVKEEGENPGAFIIGEGQYGSDSLDFEIQLKIGEYNYHISKMIPFFVQIGDYAVRGDFRRNITNVTLENMVLSVLDQQSSKQDHIFSKSKNYNLDNPLACVFTEENLKTCDKYLSVEGQEIEK